jgi:hypothetical protein
MEAAMKSSQALLVAMAVAAVAVIPADLLYTSRFLPRFKELEKQRIITSNQLATAKIVSENLNHVRDLVYHNMDFAGQKDSVDVSEITRESQQAAAAPAKNGKSVAPAPVPSRRGVTIKLHLDTFRVRKG